MVCFYLVYPLKSFTSLITAWMGRNGLLLDIFAHPVVLHFRDQKWISKTVYYIRCVIVCKIFSCSEFPNISEKPRRRRWRTVRPWSLLTILNFSTRGRQTQRYFNVSSPSSRRDNNKKKQISVLNVASNLW